MELEKWIDKGYDTIIDFGPKVLAAIVIWIIGIYAVRIVLRGVHKSMERASYDISLKNFLNNLIGWILKIALLLVVLGTLGVETTSFAAILAAAGLAIGLALQGSLANFAGGVLIMIFKPFKVGDFIQAQGESGTVSIIDIFTTKLMSIDNKEIIIPNGALSNGNIINYNSQDKRRIDLKFGVGYDSDIKKTKEILMNQRTSNTKVLSDPAPLVALSELGDSSINFVVRPWVKTADYWETYFALMEATKEALDNAGIEIPYPHIVAIRPDKEIPTTN